MTGKRGEGRGRGRAGCTVLGGRHVLEGLVQKSQHEGLGQTLRARLVRQNFQWKPLSFSKNVHVEEVAAQALGTLASFENSFLVILTPWACHATRIVCFSVQFCHVS